MHKPVEDELESYHFRTILQKNQSIDWETTISISAEGKVVNPDLLKERRTPKDLTLDNVIRNIVNGVSTKNSLNNLCEVMAFFSQAKPKKFTEALQDENWILVM